MAENFRRNTKLKLLKLSQLLSDDYLKTKLDNKTERTHLKSHQKTNYIIYPNSYMNTQSNFHINISKIAPNNSISRKNESAKKKPRNSSQCNLPYLFKEKNKKKKNYNIIGSIGGYNDYLKIKSNKAYMRMSRILMEQTLKRLSIPKYIRSKRKDRIWKEKSKSSSNEILFDDDYYETQKEKEKEKEKKVKKSKKYKNLFEKEKMKSRARFKVLLKKNFRELESCEKKFDIVIEKTMKLLSDYKDSLSYLKKE